MSDSVVDTVLAELNSPVEEPAPEDPVVEEPAPEEPAPEEPAPEEPAPEEPAPEEPAVEEPAVEEPAPEEPAVVAEPVTTQAVVQNVQEMLSSTDTSGSVNELENRVKVLEERLEKLISVLSLTGLIKDI